MTTLAAPTSPRIADRSPYVLCAVVVAFAICNIAAAHLPLDAGSVVWALLIFEIPVFSIWTALGPGRFIARLAVALPTMHLLFAISAYLTAWFAEAHWSILLAASLAWFTTYALVLVLFVLFRTFTRFRFRPISAASQVGRADFRFSLKQMIGLLTLYAFAFGVTLQLGLSKQLPVFFFTVLSAQESFDLYIEIYLSLGAIGALFALPLTAIPLLILYGQPTRGAIAVSIVFWLIVTAAFAAFLLLTPSGHYPNADEPMPLTEVCQILLIPQAFLALAGILTALPLRLTGYRLVRYAKATSPHQRSAELAA
jgi:hypothetical protein